MKYGLIPQNLREGAALALGLVPTPLADTLVTLWLARSVMVATKIGLFEALAAGPLAADEIAARCQADPRAVAKLAGALVASGYLRHARADRPRRRSPVDGGPELAGCERYSLAPVARRWLLADSPRSLRDATLWRFLDWEMTEHVECFVRTGEPLDFHATLTSEQWVLYQRGMRDHARLVAGEVARRTRLPPGASTMLDVGGGHGYLSVALCRRHPRLRAIVLDLPDAVESAAPILAGEDMGDRVVHRPGDALHDDLGEAAFDLVLIANLVHHFDEPTNRALIARAARALTPGGVLVVHELIRPSSPREAGGAGALADLYFAATSRSGTWSFEEIAAWQRAAGLRPGRPTRFVSVPGLGQVAATRPR